MKTALFEFTSAVRSRRAVVTMLLFALAGAGVMYSTVSIFATLEEQVLKLLALPAADNPGGVTMTLWRSGAFRDGVLKMLGSDLVFREVQNQHPLALAFAGFVFAVVPFLTLIASAPVAADEIRSGAVRYTLLRVTRTQWVFGVYLSEAMITLLAMLLMAVAAAAVALWRLPGWSAADCVPWLFPWVLRAWVYSLAWTGLFTGASLCTRTSGKAVGLSILLMAVTVAIGIYAGRWGCPALELLRPQSYRYLLWRTSLPPLFTGVTGTLALAALYLGLGGAVFERRDV